MVKGFTMQRLYVDNETGVRTYTRKRHYTWNQDNKVYRNDEDKTNFFSKVPEDGKQCYSLRLGQKCYFLVEIDDNEIPMI